MVSVLLPPPPAPKDVTTFGQMLRLAETLKSGGELTPGTLVDICAAAARVRFFDAELFQETLAPVLLRFLKQGVEARPGPGGCDDARGDRDVACGMHLFDIDGLLQILEALAGLNAVSALLEIFTVAAKALRDNCGSLSNEQRKATRDIYKAAGRERDVTFLSYLAPSTEDSGQPMKVRGSAMDGFNSEGLPMRPGARICEFYMKIGACKGGAMCRMDHPESLRLTFNGEGYPSRPWVAACTYYMRMGTCDYRKNCKWHHPEKKQSGGTTTGWMAKGGSMGMA